jgi:hypothetical protein
MAGKYEVVGSTNDWSGRRGFGKWETRLWKIVLERSGSIRWKGDEGRKGGREEGREASRRRKKTLTKGIGFGREDLQQRFDACPRALRETTCRGERLMYMRHLGLIFFHIR